MKTIDIDDVRYLHYLRGCMMGIEMASLEIKHGVSDIVNLEIGTLAQVRLLKLVNNLNASLTKNMQKMLAKNLKAHPQLASEYCPEVFGASSIQGA